jgi:hypothetical protein
MYDTLSTRLVVDLENYYEYWSSSILTADGSSRDKWNSSFIGIVHIMLYDSPRNRPY